MLEKEYKILLCEDQYKAVMQYFNFETLFIQTNYYYKEKNKSPHNLTVRVREKKGRLYLQVKEPIVANRGIHIKKEHCKMIDEVPKIIEGKILNELCGNTGKYNDCFLLGHLITERRTIKQEKYEIALDVNSYLGITDYELEIEFEEKPLMVIDFLKREGIFKEKTDKGKFERFFYRYQQLGGKEE